MLNRDQILARLDAGEIFRPGTWEKGAINWASYDLHIASDFLIAGGKAYPVGADVRNIVIKSGETALVSTKERLCMPWDLVGNMSPKFTLVMEGLLIHTGSIVDPGFGMRKSGKQWVAQEDERVHFFLVNVGVEPIHLRAGDAIATLQLADMDEPQEKKERKSRREQMEAKFFKAADAKDLHKKLSLAFFGLMKEYQENAEQETRKLSRRLTKLEGELRGSLSGYQQVTIFGVYVLGAALLTMFGTVLVDGGLGGVFGAANPMWLKITVAIGLMAVVLVPLIITLLMRSSTSKAVEDDET